MSGQDEYTPSVDEVREQYWMCTGDPRRGSKAWGEFDRMIEQVRREAAGEQREKDAQIAEATALGGNHDYDNGCFDAAAAIREANTNKEGIK